MVAEIGEALPDYFAAFGSNFEVNFGSRLEDGRAITTHLPARQHGAVEDARSICRATCFCRAAAAFEAMNFQRGALEALIETPLGLRSASIPSISTIAVRSNAPARSASCASAC